MAKVAAVTDEDVVEDIDTLGFVEGDLELPDVELHPACSRVVEVRDVNVALSKSSGKPSLRIVTHLPTESFQFGFSEANAPDGITSTIYVSKISFGMDMSFLASGKHGQQGVSTMRRLYDKLGVPFKNLRYGPRDDLGGHIFLSDECLQRLIGRKFKTNVTIEMNEQAGVLENKFMGIEPLA